MIITPKDIDEEEQIEVNYGKREIISRVEFERRLRNGTLPISVEPGVYRVIEPKL